MSDHMSIGRWAPCGMLSIRADLEQLGDVIGAAVAVKAPGPLGLKESADTALAWFSPDELLLICSAHDIARHQASLATALEGAHHLLSDVSDMRAGFSFCGQQVRQVLSKLMPIDLHPDAFGPGQVRRTQLGQVAAAVWMPEEDRAEILCFRSVAAYVETALAKAADPTAAIADYGK